MNRGKFTKFIEFYNLKPALAASIKCDNVFGAKCQIKRSCEEMDKRYRFEKMLDTQKQKKYVYTFDELTYYEWARLKGMCMACGLRTKSK